MASWLDRAACKGLPTSVFFWSFETRKTYGRGILAKAICANCPVTHECLEDALTVHHREQYGVYGGKTALERQKILETRLIRRNT